MGDYYRGIKGHTRSLDYSSYVHTDIWTRIFIVICRPRFFRTVIMLRKTQFAGRPKTNIDLPANSSLRTVLTIGCCVSQTISPC